MLKNTFKKTCLLTVAIFFTTPVISSFSKDGSDVWGLASVHDIKDIKSKKKPVGQTVEERSANQAEPVARNKEAARSKAIASSPTPPSTDYVFVVDQGLAQVLKEFGRSSGIAVEVDPDIRAQVHNQKIPLEQQQFIDFVTSRYEVTAAREDKVLRFSPLTPPVSRMFMLNKVPLDRLTKSAMAAGLDIKKYSMRVIPESNAIVLDAPASILGRVAALIDSLAVNPASNITIIRFGRVEETGNAQNTNLSK